MTLVAEFYRRHLRAESRSYMKHDEDILSMTHAIEAINAKLEVLDSLLAIIIATYFDPSQILRGWDSVAADIETRAMLEAFSKEGQASQIAIEALTNYVSYWRTVLIDMECAQGKSVSN